MSSLRLPLDGPFPFKANLRTVARLFAENCIFVSGSIVYKEGRILALPSLEGTGRTTLLQEMLKLDAEILEDSYFAISPCGEYMTSGGKQLPIDLLCFTEFRQKNKGLRPRRLTPGQTSANLFGHATASRYNPLLGLQAFSQLALKAPAFQGGRGEALQAAIYLLKKLNK